MGGGGSRGGAQFWAMYRAGHLARNDDVRKAMGTTVDRAGHWAVLNAVILAVRNDPPHPALADFLTPVDQRSP